jgi:putative endonuclease
VRTAPLTRLFGSLGRGKRFNRALGGAGERLAARHLHREGHRILERNWRSGSGEIDVISALPDGTVVFTEVKTRRGEGHGSPLEAVDAVKRGRIMRASNDYLRRWRLETRSVRYDLIGVLLTEEGALVEIEHVPGII